MGSFFSSNNISESTTQARKVVGAFFVVKDEKDTGVERVSPCRSMEMFINGAKKVVMKPQSFLSRPYFALDAADPPKHGVFAGWYASRVKNDDHAPTPNIMRGPMQSIARWVGATAIPGAGEDSYMDSMNKTLVASTTQQREKNPAVTSDMLWPTDRHVYTIPVKNLDRAVAWNVDYSPRNLPFAGLGKNVVQHGSVILEPMESGAKFVTDKIRDKIVSIATLIHIEPFVRAMRGVDDSASEPRSGESQKLNRWIVLIGGAHPAANKKQGGGASPWFSDVAFNIGVSLASNWEALGKYFSGIVTASGAGLCDSVTWDEEVTRGFCSVKTKEAPIFHIRDIHQVALEGMCCDVPFGHGVILSELPSPDDWSGKQRDLVLSLLAQDGLVIYGGLPQQCSNTDNLEGAIAKYSFLPKRAPLMSVVVGGASSSVSLNLSPTNLRALIQQNMPNFAAPIFDPLIGMKTLLLNLFDDMKNNRQPQYPSRQVNNPTDDEDLIWDPDNSSRRQQGRYQEQVPSRSLDIEIKYRLPIVYAVGTPFTRQRAQLDTVLQISGFAEVNVATSGYGASDDNVKQRIVNYASAVIVDIANRINNHFLRPQTNTQQGNNPYGNRYNRYPDNRYPDNRYANYDDYSYY